MTELPCQTCNGQGLIETGRMPDDCDPKPCPDCTPTLRETIARIIEPCDWGSFDRTLRPFAENRGAMAILGEAYWYERTYRSGCRSVEDAKRWWLETADVQMEPMAVFRLRESLVKADAILAHLP